jgi:hypothetical protein
VDVTAAPIELLDPTAERNPVGRPLAAPLADAPARIVLMDIRKPRGDVFLDELERRLRERGHDPVRAAKPTFTKPAPPDLRSELAEQGDAVVVALAD